MCCDVIIFLPDMRPDLTSFWAGDLRGTPEQALEMTSEDLERSQVNRDVLNIRSGFPDSDFGKEHLGSSLMGPISSDAQFRSQRALQSQDKGFPEREI